MAVVSRIGADLAVSPGSSWAWRSSPRTINSPFSWTGRRRRRSRSLPRLTAWSSTSVKHRAGPRLPRAAGARDMIAMGLAVARSGIDLMYFPATYSFFPVWNVPRLVVTMHDTLPLTHPELVFPTRSGRLAWRLKEAAAARWADRIVTVSEASRKAIQAWSGWPDERIRVITEGPDPIFRPRAVDPLADAVLERFAIPPAARYLLYVGGLSPHKNLVRLVEAFAQGALGRALLVLTGDVHDVFHTHVPEIRAAIERHRVGNRVIMTGFVADDDLVFLYSRAMGLSCRRSWRVSVCRPSKRWPAAHR